MTLMLQITLIIFSFLLLFFVIRQVNRSRVIFSDFNYWLVFILFLLLLSLSEKSASVLASILSIQTPVVAVFLVVIALLILLVLGLAFKVSILNRKFIQLTQNIALINESLSKKD
ncbi:DUF2304 family protein [Rodentibacter haemolyticus]|uniref:DUF2304 domain-containing protein n=1 Tax=Rodentibacter haemolyticus TaxID=2778911 RepID=A0ABX6UZF0_9PAST|nr:DUF2304 family protein [Rodentibacter haemolyticus]QPB43159.1 DUF2304 domain-containing protein [Rodentibacter haemolyticus]